MPSVIVCASFKVVHKQHFTFPIDVTDLFAVDDAFTAVIVVLLQTKRDEPIFHQQLQIGRGASQDPPD